MRNFLADCFQRCADGLRHGMTRQMLLDDLRYWSDRALGVER